MSNFAKRSSFSNVNNQSFSFAEAHSLPIEWSVLPFIHLSMHHKHSVLALYRILQNLIRAVKGSSLGNLSRERGSWYIENRCSVNSRPFSPHDIWHRQGREWELEKSGRERPEEKERLLKMREKLGSMLSWAATRHNVLATFPIATVGYLAKATPGWEDLIWFMASWGSLSWLAMMATWVWGGWLHLIGSQWRALAGNKEEL